MKTIKQNDDWSCSVCCVQMLTGWSREEILDFVNHEGEPKSMWEFYPILHFCGVSIGVIARTDSKVNMEIPILNSDIYKHNEFDISLSFKNKIYLFVVGDAKKKHLILWDGKKFRDPSPSIPDHTDVERYIVFEILPISFITEEKEKETLERLQEEDL